MAHERAVPLQPTMYRSTLYYPRGVTRGDRCYFRVAPFLLSVAVGVFPGGYWNVSSAGSPRSYNLVTAPEVGLGVSSFAPWVDAVLKMGRNRGQLPRATDFGFMTFIDRPRASSFLPPTQGRKRDQPDQQWLVDHQFYRAVVEGGHLVSPRPDDRDAVEVT